MPKFFLLALGFYRKICYSIYTDYFGVRTMKFKYEIVKTKGEKAYIALDFVKEYSNVTYKLYKNPNRLMIESGWGNTYSYYKVKKSTKCSFATGMHGLPGRRS